MPGCQGCKPLQGVASERGRIGDYNGCGLRRVRFASRHACPPRPGASQGSIVPRGVVPLSSENLTFPTRNSRWGARGRATPRGRSTPRIQEAALPKIRWFGRSDCRLPFSRNTLVAPSCPPPSSLISMTVPWQFVNPVQDKSRWWLQDVGLVLFQVLQR